jgi:hypothetical protein
MTSIEEAIRSGAVRLVPKGLTPKMQQDAAFNLSAEFGADFVKPLGDFARSAYAEFLSASPDHTLALLALIEERDRLKVERNACAKAADDWVKAALAAEAKCDALREALREARDEILTLYNMRGCEAEGSPEDWVGFIDRALTQETPDVGE